MKRIYLLSCVSKKLDGTHEAWKIYSPSTLFKAHWNWVITQIKKNGDTDEDIKNDIFILSAKHHLISPFEKIRKYDVTLNNMSDEEREKWAKKVYEQLKEKFNVEETEFIILAGSNYYDKLINYLPYYKLIPETPLPIGKRVQWFQQQLKK